MISILFSFVVQAAEVLPAPRMVTPGKGILLGQSLRVVSNQPLFAPVIAAFQVDWSINTGSKSKLVEISNDPRLKEEEYRIDFGPKIQIAVSTRTGLAWALQTLGQLIDTKPKVARIHDSPEVSFRCLTMDVARRFHSISTLRTMVRWCQLGKVRYLQLHLTDDQNWMLPTTVLKGIDQRNQHHQPAYTESELQDLQAFASPRGVTIVPEIDIPGHSTLLVAHDSATFKLQNSESSNCVNFGSPVVRTKLKALIQETAKLFPDSPYIHIGGDEAWYPNAEKDPQVKASITKMGPQANPGDVFVDFVGDMADEVIRLKKTPVVWEGFGPGEYAKRRISKKTVVIAWEGNYYPADKLLQDGFRVVNAGWDPNYVVNHFPYEAFTLVPLERLYKSSYKRFGIVDWAGGSKQAIDLPESPGLEGSMLCWWEGYEWNAHRVLPDRIAAFGARLWNPTGEQDYRSFKSRFTASSAQVTTRAFPCPILILPGMENGDLQFPNKEGSVDLDLNYLQSHQIAWRTDGKVPDLSDIKKQSNIPVTKDMILTIQAFKNGRPEGDTEYLSCHLVHPIENLAFLRPVTTSCANDPEFGASRVTDGVADLLSAHWIAYPNPQKLTIDLGSTTEVGRIEVVAFWATGAPTKYRLALSTDNKTFTNVVDASNQSAPSTKEGYVHRFSPVKARYIRIETLGSSLYPSTMTRINEIRVFAN
jgi:hexosaminidase